MQNGRAQFADRLISVSQALGNFLDARLAYHDPHPKRKKKARFGENVGVCGSRVYPFRTVRLAARGALRIHFAQPSPSLIPRSQPRLEYARRSVGCL